MIIELKSPILPVPTPRPSAKVTNFRLDNESDETKGDEPDPSDVVGIQPESEIVTTEDEILGYHVVKSILVGHVDLDRVFLMDRASYCNVLLDNKSRKAICRFRFTSSKKSVQIPGESASGEKISIDSINDIYNLKDRLKDRVSWLLAQE